MEASRFELSMIEDRRALQRSRMMMLCNDDYIYWSRESSRHALMSAAVHSCRDQCRLEGRPKRGFS